MVKLARIAILIAALAPHVAGACSPWLGAVHLPPGGRVLFPGTAATFSTAALTIELWVMTAPASVEDDASPDFSLSWHTVSMGCSIGTCVAIVSPDTGASPPGVVSLGPVHPYSVYAFRLEVEDVGADVEVRAYVSGDLVDETLMVGDGVEPADDDIEITNFSGTDHVYILPLRVWSTADGDPEEWLFDRPAPTDPDLLHLWRRVVDGVLVDDAGAADGTLLTGAEEWPALCWQAGDGRIFRDDFESGDLSRWSAVVEE